MARDMEAQPTGRSAGARAYRFPRRRKFGPTTYLPTSRESAVATVFPSDRTCCPRAGYSSRVGPTSERQHTTRGVTSPIIKQLNAGPDDPRDLLGATCHTCPRPGYKRKTAEDQVHRPTREPARASFHRSRGTHEPASRVLAWGTRSVQEKAPFLEVRARLPGPAHYRGKRQANGRFDFFTEASLSLFLSLSSLSLSFFPSRLRI